MITLDKLRFRMAESIFDAVVALPPEQRAAALERHCGSDAELRAFVERLIVIDAQPGTSDSEYRVFHAPVAQPAPQRIGCYRIIRPIGEGGMGVVFEAQQEHPRRSVALKMLRSGILSPRSVERFEHEAELLGQLKHAGIAQIFEAGTAEVAGPGGSPARQPFFAMELVDGQTLIEFARDRRLDIESKLDLLLQVCEAVHHAHQKGVIHRDLKPGNILVNAEGHPKVLDFGVARVVGVEAHAQTMQTVAGQLVGTIPYMSPEQLSGAPIAVDTRSDVYSLGVVAFELLTGALPYDVANVTVPNAIRIISEGDARRAGNIVPDLRGDLEAILAKALEKDIDRRYGSCAELASDIRRCLSHQPVLARPLTFAYQFSRFVRRHRGLIAAAAVTLFALVAGTIGTATFAIRESRQVERAEAQVARAESILRLLREMLASVDPRTRAAGAGADVTVREVLDDAANRIQSGELAGQPEVETALWRTMCETYLNLGHYAEARTHLQRAVAQLRKHNGLISDDGIAILNLQGRALDGLTLFAEAEQSHLEALNAAGQLYGEQDVRFAAQLNDMGESRRRAGKLPEAQAFHRRALALRETLPTATQLDLAESLGNLGVVLQGQAQFEEAEGLLRRALEIQRLHSAPDLDLADALGNLSSLLRRRGSLDEAESLMGEALQIYRRRLDPSHPDLAQALHDMAMIVKRGGRAAAALPMVRESLQIQLDRLGPAHRDVAAARLGLAFLLNELGQIEEAINESTTALDIMRQTFGPRHQEYGYALHNVAALRNQAGDSAGAEKLLREAVSIIDECLGPTHDNAAHMRDSLAAALIKLGSYEEAVRILIEVVDLKRKLLGQKHDMVGLSLGHLAEARMRVGDAAGAHAAVTEALEILHDDPPAGPDLATLLLVQAEATVSLDNPIDAAVLRESIARARQLYAERFGEGCAHVADTRRVEALLLVRLGGFAEAETKLTEALHALDALASVESLSSMQKLIRRRIVRGLASLYREWDKPELAARWSVAE